MSEVDWFRNKHNNARDIHGITMVEGNQIVILEDGYWSWNSTAGKEQIKNINSEDFHK